LVLTIAYPIDVAPESLVKIATRPHPPFGGESVTYGVANSVWRLLAKAGSSRGSAGSRYRRLRLRRTVARISRRLSTRASNIIIGSIMIGSVRFGTFVGRIVATFDGGFVTKDGIDSGALGAFVRMVRHGLPGCPACSTLGILQGLHFQRYCHGAWIL
jgi:hypothetical protein